MLVIDALRVPTPKVLPEFFVEAACAILPTLSEVCKNKLQGELRQSLSC